MRVELSHNLCMAEKKNTTDTHRSTPNHMFGTNFTNIEDDVETRSKENDSVNADMDIKIMNNECNLRNLYHFHEVTLRDLQLAWYLSLSLVLTIICDLYIHVC